MQQVYYIIDKPLSKKNNTKVRETMSQEIIQHFIDNMGLNHSALEDLIEKHYEIIRSFRNDKGGNLLNEAIQFNDGGAVRLLIDRVGLEITPEIYQYAKDNATYNGREPFAFNAIDTFHQLKKQSPITIMTHSDFRSISNCVSTAQSNTIKLYHGTNSTGLNQQTLDWIHDIAQTGVAEVSNSPTLSLAPSMSFWKPGCIGFCYEIPRNQVAFDQEDPTGKAVWVDSKSGIARILTNNKMLNFKDYSAEVIHRAAFFTDENEVQESTYRTRARINDDYNHRAENNNSLTVPVDGHFKSEAIPIESKFIAELTQIKNLVSQHTRNKTIPKLGTLSPSVISRYTNQNSPPKMPHHEIIKPSF